MEPIIIIVQLATGDPIELKDPSGNVLGVFVPEGLGKLPPGAKSPFNEEERAELRRRTADDPQSRLIQLGSCVGLLQGRHSRTMHLGDDRGSGLDRRHTHYRTFRRGGRSTAALGYARREPRNDVE